MGFEPVEQHPDFPALERRVLERWRGEKIFQQSVDARADGPLFRFYEGPPTANGQPGVHHVESRAFKDLFPRYRTMKGYRVPRRGGWDCHGIPVEIAVEKELGFTRKSDIEAFGVAAFNARCRASVTRYVEDWERLTQRIGFWVDTDDAYWTMSTPYVESVWWSLAELWSKGLIYEGHKVVPYCPRCGTALSDHEVALGYDTAVDPSVYVRLPVLEDRLAEEGAALLVWTTTPWTLVSNTAVAIGADIAYVLARRPTDDGPLVLAAERVTEVLGEDAEIIRTVSSDELYALHYRAPFDDLDDEVSDDWHYVTVADFVTIAEGTGLVHLAPAFGADDMAVARTDGLPVVNPVDLEGCFDARVPALAGQFVKAADPAIIEMLRDRGLLVRSGEYTHTYPFCWRCSTPLLYYAKPSWYIATTTVRDRLLEVNSQVDWHPPHIREGRYGDWLRNNVDWSLSRERYWGTPLPLWRCEQCDTVTAVSSLADLGEKAGRDVAGLDPHRPAVDEITIACPACKATAHRVPEVIDAWYDSGSMPFAQMGYPHVEGSTRQFEDAFPADFICEAIDQTRGWFYSLMAVSTLLFDANSYRTVLCLGHIVDAEGKKMSKSLGNVLDPWELIESRGADALRWLLLTDGSPWLARRVGPEPLDEVTRKFLLTLWNTYYFFATYARIDGWEPASSQAPPVGERQVLDRWVLAELAEVVRVVDRSLDGFDATTAGRAIAVFVDDLSNWYVRRSRQRFWTADDVTSAPGADKDAAFSTLHECLVTLAALVAPFIPFLADELYGNLVGAVDPHAPASVHLLDFPTVDERAVDDGLRAAMGAARRTVELGRRARNDAKVGLRQPLRQALVTVPADVRETWPTVAGVVADELNVKHLGVPDSRDGLVTHRVKPNFRALGPDFGKRTPAVAAAIEAADPAILAAALAETGEAEVLVDGAPVRVTAEQAQVHEESARGWQVSSDGPFSIALDLALDDELRREGLAREWIRALNDLRKQAGLAFDDRIELEVAAEGEPAAALDEHAAGIASEVLAVSLRRGTAEGGQALSLSGGAQVRVRLAVAR
ncbi:MAG: isoleucine--tRNA ligase [Egibacteraceae bacterium]